MRGAYDERPAEDGDDLVLVVSPSSPKVTEHEVGSRRVIELPLTIAILKDGNVDASEGPDISRLFGPNTVLAAKCVAGYVAKEPADDGNLVKFEEMLQHACEQLYQVVRSKAISIAADAGFDASDIPAEVESEKLFAKKGQDPAEMKEVSRKTRKRK
jgi:hypothetical protein